MGSVLPGMAGSGGAPARLAAVGGSPLVRRWAGSAASREDVRQGYVTVKSAAELYGVVLDPQSFEVDAAATAKLRAARRGGDGRAADAKLA